MSPQFDWQVGDDDGDWETIVQTAQDGRRWRVLTWVLTASLVGIISAVACTFLVVRKRYGQASGQISFQIQSVVDLEARAFSEGDQDLLLAQQDEAFSLLYPSDAQRRGRRTFMPPVGILPAMVEDVNVQGDVAWVHVIEGDPAVRRVRFYRQTDQGWLHTMPDLAFWRDPIQHVYSDQLVFYYHQRDQPYIDPMVERLVQAFSEVCASINCDNGERFDVLFYPAPADGDIRADLTLPSPWLSGIPIDGEGSERYLEAALATLETRVTAWAVTSDAASPFTRGQSSVTERWLGISPVTPEMLQLNLSLFGRGQGFRGRFESEIPRSPGQPEGKQDYMFP